MIKMVIRSWVNISRTTIYLLVLKTSIGNRRKNEIFDKEIAVHEEHIFADNELRMREKKRAARKNYWCNGWTEEISAILNKGDVETHNNNNKKEIVIKNKLLMEYTLEFVDSVGIGIIELRLINGIRK